MKTSRDPRHKKRILHMQALFSYSFSGKHIPKSLSGIREHLPAIDACIQEHAPEWPVQQLSKIDLAILRLAIYELLYEKKAPAKVIIDEAVELAKAYGNENSPKFINGALGAVIKISKSANDKPAN